MKHHCIVKAGELEDDTKLYKYISLSQFLSFIENKQMHLTRVKEWEDTWEVPTSGIPLEGEGGELIPWDVWDDMYAQCWSLCGESDALWRIYSPQKEGVLIQTTVRKFGLIEGIKFGLLAPVIYYENLEDGLKEVSDKDDYLGLYGAVFLKRKAFEHEQEVRLVARKGALGVNCENCKYINIDLDFIEFIESIIIDPRADDWYVDTIQKYCKRAGFRIIPIKSNLYSSSVFESTGLTIESLVFRSSGLKIRYKNIRS